MSVTQDDLNQFHQFAVVKISNGGAESVSQLAAQWEAVRDYDDTVAELRQCAEDMEKGIGPPLREVDAELRSKHGFVKRNDA